MALVFLYGALMPSARLNSPNMLDGIAAPMGPARTVGSFDLDFSCRNPQYACATATLTPNPHTGRPIFGGLYDIPDDRIYRTTAEAPSLDGLAGEGETYQRSNIDVVLLGLEDRPFAALTYLARAPEVYVKTELHYAMHLFAGLREFNAPDEYLRYVRFRVIRTNPKLADALEKL